MEQELRDLKSQLSKYEKELVRVFSGPGIDGRGEDREHPRRWGAPGGVPGPNRVWHVRQSESLPRRSDGQGSGGPQ